MILLDTNVVSAMMLADGDPVVRRWLDSVPPESLWTTSVTVFEISYRLAILPAGRKRRDLEEAFDRSLKADFEGRVLSLDSAAAKAAGSLAAERRRRGRPIEIRDAQIAGIAAVRQATIATRNVRDFELTGVAVVDPWAD